MILKRLTALLLALAMVLSMGGCKKDEPVVTAPVQTQPVVTEAPVPEAGEMYAAAKVGVENAADLKLRITVEKTTQAGPNTYLETSHQVLSYQGRGTGSQRMLLSEAVIYGDGYYTGTYQDVYADGTLYSLVDGETRLACAADAAAVEAQLTPAVLLDAALYGSMERQEENGRYVITFTQPTGAETWALPEGAEFVEASGCAEVNADGSLYRTSYTVSYNYGAARITENYSVLPDLESTAIEVPSDAAQYATVNDLEAVRMSQRAVGMLMQVPAFSSTTTETLVSMAGALSRTETKSLKASLENGMLVEVDTNATLTNLTDGETDTYTLEEKFWGEYSYVEDGGEKQKDDSVDAYTMYEYTMETLMDSMVALDYWKSAEITDAGDLMLLELKYNDQLAADLRADTCQALLGDAKALDEYSTATAVTEVSGYLSLDKYTGLPLAASYTYTGTDVIEDQSFAIAAQSVQSYITPDDSVYYAITGDTLEVEEPAQKAAPLLYKVTGADGQKMYLMGTIHVGDNRTAYLPQELYQALEESAALAVEFDLYAFEEKAQTSEAVQQAVASSYYYTDGTTVVDHADVSLLEEAEKAMKATGNYSSSLAYMKPAFWAQSLENTYLRQGYSLSGSQGADRRLLQWADENDMMIVDIESGEEQLAMMGNYSDGLQEMLLEAALSYEPGEYWQEVAELYEMWCQGDEGALRERLNDTSDYDAMSEDEKALYEEYHMAMIHDRNEGMLEEAKGYLESGHTIFFAVGLAHLLQDNGLVDGLRDAGYTVQTVLYG